MLRRITFGCLAFRFGACASEGEQWIATRIATALNLCLSASIRRHTETSSELLRRDVPEHPRTPNMTLGVKWSQVQILSARPEKIGGDLLRCRRSAERDAGRSGPFGDQYSCTRNPCSIRSWLRSSSTSSPSGTPSPSRSTNALPPRSSMPHLADVEIDMHITNASQLALACGGFLDDALAGRLSHSNLVPGARSCARRCGSTSGPPAWAPSRASTPPDLHRGAELHESPDERGNHPTEHIAVQLESHGCRDHRHADAGDHNRHCSATVRDETPTRRHT